jgi:hypothetical protein
MLLVRAGEPRSIWAKHAPEALPGEIDPSAVTEVLRSQAADESAPAAGDVEGIDGVRAALDGTALSPATLERFIAAFDLGPRHATRLRQILRGSDSVRVISGDALADLYRQSGPPRHETLAVHELHTLGPDGLPAEHQTIQVIRSTVDDLDTYPYRFDTNELVVEVVRGGRVGDIYRLTETLFGVDIVLDRSLAPGETALMHYRTTFLYHTPPPTEFRRGVLGVMKDVTLWVQFHPDRLPARVWLARWDRLDHATVIDHHLVEMDGEHSVQVRYDEVEQSIVGFHWEWE